MHSCGGQHQARARTGLVFVECEVIFEPLDFHSALAVPSIEGYVQMMVGMSVCFQQLRCCVYPHGVHIARQVRKQNVQASVHVVSMIAREFYGRSRYTLWGRVLWQTVQHKLFACVS